MGKFRTRERESKKKIGTYTEISVDSAYVKIASALLYKAIQFAISIPQNASLFFLIRKPFIEIDSSSFAFTIAHSLFNID